jgi:hypothetical protein
MKVMDGNITPPSLNIGILRFNFREKKKGGPRRNRPVTRVLGKYNAAEFKYRHFEIWL